MTVRYIMSEASNSVSDAPAPTAPDPAASALSGGPMADATMTGLLGLQRLAAVVSHPPDADALFDQALQTVVDAFHLDMGLLLLRHEDPDGQVSLRVQCHCGLRHPLLPTETAVSLMEDNGCRVAAAVRDGQPAFIADAAASVGADGLVAREQVVSLLILPLPALGQAVGALALGQRRPRTFTPPENALLTVMAQLIGGAASQSRHQAEAEIRRLKELNEQIVQGLAEGILLEDTQGIITFANPKMSDLLGYANGELLGMHWTALVPPPERPRVQAELSRRPGGLRGQYETRLLTRHGRTIPVIVNATPLMDGGRYQGVLAAFTDITQRKRTEETLHALNAAAVTMQATRDPEAVYHAAAQELAKLGMFAALFSLNHAQQTLTVRGIYGNPEPIAQVEGALGFPLKGLTIPLDRSPVVGDVIGRQRTVFTHDVKALLRQAVTDLVGAAVAARAAEAIRPVNSIIAPLSASGQTLGVLMVMSPALTEDDIPAVTAFAHQVAVALQNAQLYQALRQRAEQLQQAYADLKELDRFRDEVVQNVSHDLRSPLTFIQGYAELLLSGAMGDLNGEQRNALDIIFERSQQLLLLANDIISPERAQLTSLALRTLSLAEVARAALRGAEVMAEEHGLSFVLDAPADLPPVQADGQRLGQVFDNLLSNAIKYSPRGGQITIRLRAVDGGSVRAEVMDQGIGIAPEQLERIWQRFYQVGENAAGAGIGLNIVKRIIEAHGGTVGVASVPAQGSIFYFTLPGIAAP